MHSINRRIATPELVSSSLENLTTHAVSRSKAAPYGALCSAGRSRYARSGGAYRDRTDDLMLAKQPLSQLS